MLAVLFVLPITTHAVTDAWILRALHGVCACTAEAAARLAGLPHADPAPRAAELEQLLGRVRLSLAPLVHPLNPMRGRKRRARRVLALLDDCAREIRGLVSVAADPEASHDVRLTTACRRVETAVEALTGGALTGSRLVGGGSAEGGLVGEVVVRGGPAGDCEAADGVLADGALAGGALADGGIAADAVADRGVTDAVAVSGVPVSGAAVDCGPTGRVLTDGVPRVGVLAAGEPSAGVSSDGVFTARGVNGCSPAGAGDLDGLGDGGRENLVPRKPLYAPEHAPASPPALVHLHGLERALAELATPLRASSGSPLVGA